MVITIPTYFRDRSATDIVPEDYHKQRKDGSRVCALARGSYDA